jgi:dihydroorotate dehydrogenase
MYKAIIRPILFLIDAEKVHHLVVLALRFLDLIPGLKSLLEKCFTYNNRILSTNIAGLEFRNKVGLAAGFDKNADFFNPFSVFGFSFIEIGTVTPMPQPGNEKPRLFRLIKDSALINRMGFNNKGVDYAAKQLKLKSKGKKVIIGGNIGKNTATPNESAANDYAVCFSKLYDFVDYFAINVSCPNIEGLDSLQEKGSLKTILDKIMTIRSKKEVKKPVFLKISPDLAFNQIDEIIELYHTVGLDGIIATNTTTSRNELKTDNKTITKIDSGGLSGEPLRSYSLKIISYICKQSKNTIPIIGVGGIMTCNDALDMIKAGASLIQIYTGFIYEGPFIVKRMNKIIAEYLSGQVNNAS